MRLSTTPSTLQRHVVSCLMLRQFRALTAEQWTIATAAM
jgi:hypothetical protein